LKFENIKQNTGCLKKLAYLTVVKIKNKNIFYRKGEKETYKSNYWRTVFLKNDKSYVAKERVKMKRAEQKINKNQNLMSKISKILLPETIYILL